MHRLYVINSPKLVKNMSKQDTNKFHLTLKAAQYMSTNNLVMRNSFTKQLRAVHYRIRYYPDADRPGNGRYCTPLWTVGRPEFLKDIESRRLQLTDKINFDDWDTKYAYRNLENVENLENYLHAFEKKIKESFRFFTAFSNVYDGLYEFELLISKTYGLSIDDLGRYPTGGRCHHTFNQDSIIYRVSFNELEIALFKKILSSHYDHLIFSVSPAKLQEKNEKTVKSIRLFICNELATEIIFTKLMGFMNSCGQSKTVIALSEDYLNKLLYRVTLKKTKTTQQYLTDNFVGSNVNYYDDYCNTEKYTHSLFVNYKYDKSLPITSKLSKASKRCKDILETLKTIQTDFSDRFNRLMTMLQNNHTELQRKYASSSSQYVLKLSQELIDSLNKAHDDYLKQKNNKTFLNACSTAINKAKNGFNTQRNCCFLNFLSTLYQYILNLIHPNSTKKTFFGTTITTRSADVLYAFNEGVDALMNDKKFHFYP